MPLKEWEIFLPEGFKIIIRKETVLGKWIDFAVVLVFDGVCITRYDCSHDFPHRDVLGREGGLIRKERCWNMTMKEAFDHAILDLKSDYSQHYNFFASH
jgi:hypothetical protein